jgi:hypothetical protein
VNSATKPNHQSTAIRLLFWGFGLLYVSSRFIPGHMLRGYPSNTSVDDAWAQILHVAYAQHMQFGRDIVFTYGPWGFLARGYSPQTYLVSSAAWLILSVVFICAGWRLACYFTPNQAVAWIWLIGFTAAASLPGGNDVSNRLWAWGVLLIFLHFFVEEVALSPLQAALVFTLAWLGLVKFTGFLEGVFLVAVIAMDNITRQRRFPWIILVWLAGIFFFWLLAGQQAGLLGPFLRNSWAMANGYTDAMNEGNLYALDPLFYSLIGVGFCVLSAMLVRPARWVVRIFFGLGMCGILFLSFKQGYVGDDLTHEIASAMTLILIGLACLAVAVATRKLSMISAVVFLFYAAITLASDAFARQSSNFGGQLVGTLSIENLFAPVTGLTTKHLPENYKNRLSALRETTPLPPVRNGADLYSCHQAVLFANEMAYRPRPVIQSYSAYTPALAKMNADWLQTVKAAPDLFFAIQPLADRFPSLDDGLSWPELLTLYDINGQSDAADSYLCLSRSATPRGYRLVPLGETAVALGKFFTLPLTNGPVWAEIEIDKTFAGDLLSFFYKPAVLMADAKLADGSVQRCRLIPGITRAGFLLSPYIADNASFIALARRDEKALAGKEVVSMTVFEGKEPHSTFCYQPGMTIRFYRLDFPAQDVQLRVLKTSINDG